MARMFAAKAVIRLSANLGETLMRPAGPRPDKGFRMKLLLVEDDPTMQATLQRSFQRRGMQVVVCGDGAARSTAGRRACPTSWCST